ncbi:MAG TPA: alkaline phosphatase family protein [Terracidiphilus sp.]|nr:alkaline phosphatase family protein [Terracidiphilus sp.]
MRDWWNISALSFLLALPILAGCGSGSNISPPPASSVTVACKPASIAPGATSQCTATVLGAAANHPVSWSASSGTITSTGLFTSSLVAGNVTVTATSTQNSMLSGAAVITVQPITTASKHVVMVIEENQSYSTVVGNTTAWPHLNALASTGALPTHYFANVHPSIGNYFMLTTGQVLTIDDSSTTIWNVDNIARRMLAAGVSFRVYAEGIPQGYLGGDTGLYVIRHNPFAMLSDVANNPSVANQTIWPFTQFAADVASHSLPDFSFIVPDLNDDAHNGTPLQADNWLQSNVIAPLSGYPAFQPGGDGILIVDFDEADFTDFAYGGGHVAPVLWGPAVRSGYIQTSNTIYQHQSMLRAVMESLGLPDPPGAAIVAPSMSEFFVQK